MVGSFGGEVGGEKGGGKPGGGVLWLAGRGVVGWWEGVVERHLFSFWIEEGEVGF